MSARRAARGKRLARGTTDRGGGRGYTTLRGKAVTFESGGLGPGSRPVVLPRGRPQLGSAVVNSSNIKAKGVLVGQRCQRSSVVCGGGLWTTARWRCVLKHLSRFWRATTSWRKVGSTSIHFVGFFELPAVRDACKTSIQKRRWNILLPLQPCRGSRLNEVRGGRGDGLVTE